MQSKNNKNYIPNFVIPKEGSIDSSEIQRLIDFKIEEYFKNKKSKRGFFDYLKVFLLGMILIALVFNVFIFYKPVGNVETTQSNYVSYTNVESVVDKDDISTKRITTFLGNPAIIEIGNHIDVSKNNIATKNSNNCKSPTVPAEVNGCGFVLAPGFLDIPKSGIMLSTIQFEGSIEGKSKVSVDIKDYNKSRLTGTVATFDGESLNAKIKIPSTLKSTDTFYIRLWQVDAGITINQITLEYFNIEQLKTIKGKIIKPNSIASGTASVYWDVDKNGKYDKDLDEKWICKENFVGVKSVEYNKDGVFELIRDDSCFKGNLPEYAKGDGGKNALPPGHWLMILDKDNTVYPFQIETLQGNKELELKLK